MENLQVQNFLSPPLKTGLSFKKLDGSVLKFF